MARTSTSSPRKPKQDAKVPDVCENRDVFTRKPKPPDLNFAAAPFSRRQYDWVAASSVAWGWLHPWQSHLHHSLFLVLPGGMAKPRYSMFLAGIASITSLGSLRGAKRRSNLKIPRKKGVDSAANSQYYIHQSIICQVHLDTRYPTRIENPELGIEERSCNGFYHCNLRNTKRRLLPTRSSHECHRQG